MRTTVDLAEDVFAEVSRLRREQGLGLSEAVNELARAGMFAKKREPYTYRQSTYDLGALVDLTNVAEVLELLDEHDAAQRAESSRRVG